MNRPETEMKSFDLDKNLICITLFDIINWHCFILDAIQFELTNKKQLKCEHTIKLKNYAFAFCALHLKNEKQMNFSIF